MCNTRAEIVRRGVIFILPLKLKYPLPPTHEQVCCPLRSIRRLLVPYSVQYSCIPFYSSTLLWSFLQVVYALYPQTTCFYKAVVHEAPARVCFTVFHCIDHLLPLGHPKRRMKYSAIFHLLFCLLLCLSVTTIQLCCNSLPGVQWS